LRKREKSFVNKTVPLTLKNIAEKVSRTEKRSGKRSEEKSLHCRKVSGNVDGHSWCL
jgi:hypothetical protein